MIEARLRAAGCVYAEDEAALLSAAAHTPSELDALVERRVTGVPLEHLLGWAEFCGIRVAVGPGVFVPRRRTELLVREAAARLRPGAVVLDLCCGSGAVGAALAARGARVYAVDLDDTAVHWARRNLPAGRVFAGDLYEPLPSSLRGTVDVVVANAPYVPTAELRLLPAEARLHEPAAALDGGADGLDVQRRVIAGAPSWLAPAGSLLVETSEQQALHTAAAVVACGLAAAVVRRLELDATAVVGSR